MEVKQNKASLYCYMSSKLKYKNLNGNSNSKKTTSLIKLASKMILNQHKHITIISTNNSKINTTKQMKIFTQILNMPFLSIHSQQN